MANPFKLSDKYPVLSMPAFYLLREALESKEANDRTYCGNRLHFLHAAFWLMCPPFVSFMA
jgi:hypothetical protein